MKYNILLDKKLSTTNIIQLCNRTSKIPTSDATVDVYMNPVIELPSKIFNNLDEAFKYLHTRGAKFRNLHKKISQSHWSSYGLPLEQYKLDILADDEDTSASPKIFVADTENCKKKEYLLNELSSQKEIEGCEMNTYLCGLSALGSGVHFYFSSMEKYINFINNLPYLKTKIFYHNLSYDIEFHMDYIINNYKRVYTRCEKIRGNKNVKISPKRLNKLKNEKTYNKINYIKVDSEFDEEKTYSVAESEMTKYFLTTFDDALMSIKKVKKSTLFEENEIDWNKIEVSTYTVREVKYSDFYKILSSKLSDLAIMVGVPKHLRKGQIDYESVVNKITTEHIDYFYCDIFILDACVTWCKQFKIPNKASKSLDEFITLPQFALKYWEEEIKGTYKYYSHDRMLLLKEGEQIHNENISEFYVFEPKKKYNKNKTFILLPELSFIDDEDIRKGYYGGYTYANPTYKGHDHLSTQALSVDRTSQYPSEMINRPMPIGEPTYHDTTETYKKLKKKKPKNSLRTYCILIESLDLKKQKKNNIYIPTIMPKGYLDYKTNTYINKNINIKGERTSLKIWLNESDIEHMIRNYKVDFIVLGYFEFNICNNLFDKYVLTFAEIKKNTDNKSLRSFAKLMLNSLYGKFATKTRKKEYEYIKKNGVCKKEEKIQYIDKSIYTPISSFITSFSRDSLFNLIYNVEDKFYYCDTDSIHAQLSISQLKEKTKDITTNTKELIDGEIFSVTKPLIDFKIENYLSGWKVENIISSFKTLKAKAYIEYGYDYTDYYKDNLITPTKTVKCAGVKAEILKEISKLEINEAFHVFDYSQNYDISEGYEKDNRGFLYDNNNNIIQGKFIGKKVFLCRKGKVFVDRFISIKL